ncbi:hypothetical protein MHYP_G00351630 [Metynnis hypsauchen]
MKLEDFEFVFILYTYDQIFSETDVVFEIVQQRAMDALYCKKRIESLLAFVKEKSSEGAFQAVYAKAAEKPKLRVEPQSPDTVTLSCELPQSTGWTIMWKKNSDILEHDVTTITETLPKEGGAEFKCAARRGHSYTPYSDLVKITVVVKVKPTITSNHEGAALTGNTVTLYCKLHQSAGWTFYWSKHTQNSENETITNVYSISSVSLSDGGQYWCRAGRGNPVYYTHYSDALWVNVTDSTKAVVSIKPDKQVFKGESVTLRCDMQAGGDTEWTYSWYKDDRLSTNRRTQEFTISSVTESNGGKYACRGERKHDFQSSEISDAVTLTVSDVAQAVLSVYPQSWLTEGDSVTLSCEVTGSSTGWTFSWYRAVLYRQGLQQIRDVHGNVLYHVELLLDSRREAGGSYTLSPAALNHTGVYVCRAERGEPAYQTQYSTAQTLWITDGDVILDSPVHPVTEGDSLTLRCLFRSTKLSNLTADFYKDGSLLQTQTTGEMIIRTVSKSDEGLYHCKHPERGESPQSWLSVRGDSAAQPSDVTYAQIMTTNSYKGNSEAVRRPNDVTYSQIQMKNFNYHSEGL